MPALLNSVPSEARQVIKVRQGGNRRACALHKGLVTVVPVLIYQEKPEVHILCAVFQFGDSHLKNKKTAAETKQKRLWYRDHQRAACVLDDRPLHLGLHVS